MPLPFLTADHDTTDGRGGETAALPHDGPDHWRRPYRPGSWRVGAASLLLLLAAFVLLSATVIALAGAPATAALVTGAGLFLVAFTARMLRVGVWVSAYGLRQVEPLRTTTLAWSQVAAVRTERRPVRWLGLPRTVRGRALIVQRADGGSLRPLLTDHSGDFLARPEAFDRAADVLAVWVADHR
ncbi:PH domain-containing protein [Streptomyces sp. MST-110588]|uniref:PH domain-containing protein n=1 Tax=Streptomyces sp. MST-110588 TaxID=2833628 RepID=UPI001F5D29DF|nr:PH domain-containing protein [Streptomyces sp. MST-110588]UNO39633.1 PH domain-containing protein [Streptomyces sp. MST-110588]